MVASATPEDQAWRLVLEPLPRAGRLRVVVETPRPVRWELPPVGRRFHEDVAPRRVSYEIAPSSNPPCVFEVTPDRAAFCGAAVLPTPEEDEIVDVAIRLVSDETFHPEAASSYGIGRRGSVHARFGDLHLAGFVFGNVQHAVFTAEVGRDHAAWVGFFSFDPRWVAAEAAGVRTAVDRWLGITRPSDEPSVGLLLVGRSEPGLAILPLRRGALVQAGPSLFWDARARVDLTRLWVQRTVGRAIRVDHPQARWWFDEGFAHGVALVVLRDMGVLTPEEVAGEVGGWLAQQAFGDEDEPARSSAVRGALFAVALQGAGGHAERTLRAMLERRAAGGRPELPSDDFFALVLAGDSPRGSRLEQIVAAFRAERPTLLQASDVDPCARLETKRVHRFDLGFGMTDDGRRVAELDRGSAASRAGIRLDDELISVDYVAGRGDLPATVVVERDGEHHTLRFHPRGPARWASVVTIASGCDAP